MTTDVYGQPVKKPNPFVWLAIGCAVLLMGIIAFVAVIVISVFGSMRNSVPYKDSVARAVRDPRVIADLGSPVTASFFVLGSIGTKDDEGQAKLDIPLAGPKGTAFLNVRAVKVSGKWTYSEMRVVTGKSTINLLEGSPGKAPPAS